MRPDDVTGANAVPPLVNLGFGSRVALGNMCFSLEAGAADLVTPYALLSAGWQG